MITIRVATAHQDASMFTQHNCAIALETENKILAPKVAHLGVFGLFIRPQLGFE